MLYRQRKGNQNAAEVCGVGRSGLAAAALASIHGAHSAQVCHMLLFKLLIGLQPRSHKAQQQQREPVRGAVTLACLLMSYNVEIR